MENDLTFYLATFWGAYLIVGSLALLFIPSFKEKVLAVAKNERSRVALGVILGIAGILHISFHNVWTVGPAIIVSLFGWMMLMKSIILLMLGSLERFAEAYFASRYSGFVYLFLICVGFFLIQSVNPVLKF